MKVGYVNYYSEFECIGKECPDSCCDAWNIKIDNQTFIKYMSVPGEFGKKLRNSIDLIRRVFKTEGKRCPMLGKDMLCEIHKNLGPDMLCRTCRIFPRHMEDYGTLREYTLSMACPRAAEMILTAENSAFVYKEFSGEPVYDTDEVLLDGLLTAREYIRTVISSREYPFKVKVALAMSFAHDVQVRIKKQNPAGIKTLCELYSQKGTTLKLLNKLERYENRPEEKYALIKKYIGMLEGLDYIGDEFPKMIKSVKETLYNTDATDYAAKKEDFDGIYLKFLPGVYENILLYYLNTYFAGAVYDKRAFEKFQFAVYACLVINEINAAHYIKYNSFSLEDQINQSHWYSKEIENSDYNLEALMTILSKNRQFEIDNLMVLVLNH